MTSIVFIVSGDPQSAMAYRARAFAAHLRERYDIQLAYREGNKLMALFRFLKFLRRLKPQVTYVFDMSYSGVLASWLHKLFSRNNLLIVETGDVIYELMRSTGNRSRLGLGLTRWLENFSLRVADRIVVRGSYHQRWLAERGVSAEVIQDGVDTAEFAPQNADDLRHAHGLNGALAVGLVGSSIWSEKLGVCYGWELIELMRLLEDQPVKGVMIGGGTGVAHLKARCREYGIEEKMIFLGQVAYEQLPAHLGMMDVCLSTQSNDIVGQVRTTGKLPLYLAAGRFVLASKVGEAALVLEPKMLVPYDGVVDREYPRKLAERVRGILADRKTLESGVANISVAKEVFEYSKLAERLGEVIERVVGQTEKREKGKR
ncbi:MAG TPA: glycosyltransferase [Pyrinomonadaceae bacterium]